MKKIKIVFILFIGMIFVLACGDPIPIQEMSTAKSDISKAKAIKADKYAKTEYEEAIKLLKQSHTQIKDDKLEDAAKSAADASVKANEAYAKALPILAKETIDIAENSINLAEEAYASEFALEDYTKANSKLEEARSQYEQKDYYNSYLNALEADKLAKNARNSALSQKGTLQDAIDEVKMTIEKAKQYNAEEHAPEKLQSAMENLEIAESSYDDLMLKKGFEAIGVAKADADEAYIASIKESALNSIQKAEEKIKVAESSKGANSAQDELNGAKELLSTSKSQFDETLYIEALNSAEESQKLANIVITTGKSGSDSNMDSGEDYGNEGYVIYTVKLREAKLKDCLWIIARKFYNNPRKWKVIYNANRDRIKDPNLIRPGWKLKIPKPVVTEK